MRLTHTGCVTVGTCTSQLLYEIQGPLYYNCDVTADITDVKMEQVGEDLVRVTGVKGLPPPPTTKVGITAPAGWQCEWHMFVCGLDIEEKCKITEDQIRYGRHTSAIAAPKTGTGLTINSHW
jgi:hypothetical protein